VYARTTALATWIDSVPGIGPTGEAANGPGNTAAPTVTARPLDYHHARVTITPAATGPPASRWTVWAREGAPRSAIDIFIGTTSKTIYDAKLPAINSSETFRVLVRPNGEFGDGPSAVVTTRPLIDRFKPSVPRGVKVTRRGALAIVTWSAARDTQSGTWGYWVQRKVNGRWRTPVQSRVTRFSFRAGTGHGSVRVLAEDWADNRGAFSAAVAY
jgi:hypothetical protein